MKRQEVWPKLSVIVPTRGRPTLLKRSVISILNQDYPGDIECLVVYDRKPSTQLRVQYHLRRRKLRFLLNSRTPNLAGARNAGMLAAQGEVIAFCDDDDEWLSDKARRQVEMLGRVDRALVGCGIYVRSSGHDIVRRPPAETTLSRLLRTNTMELHPSTWLLWRIDLLKTMFDENMRYAEDYDWLLRIARKMRIVATQAPLVRVHWDRKSWFVGRWATIIDSLGYLLRKHSELQSDRRGLARLYGQIAFAHAALGDRAQANIWTAECISLNRIEVRAYFSLLVSSRIVKTSTILNFLNFFGRGL